MIRGGSNGLRAHFTHHMGLPAAALAADKPGVPIEHWGPGVVPGSYLGGVGLDLMLAILAPHDQPDAGGSSVAERHRRTQHLGKALQHSLYGLGVIPKVPQVERQ
jgi:hypothetical protein